MARTTTTTCCVLVVLATICGAAHVVAGGKNHIPITTVDGQSRVLFWVDYPGSEEYARLKPQWYDRIMTETNTTFETSGGAHVTLGWNDKGAIHLFANPDLLMMFDERIVQWNGADASTLTGAIDACGWPNTTAQATPTPLQYAKRTTPMVEDFAGGLDPSTMVVGLQKGCCAVDKYADNPYHKNINVVRDVVNGVEKNVIALTAWNEDDPATCPGTGCHKIVSSSGTLASADLYASGRYEVVAKVPDAPGMVWAIWTFHYEEHLPVDCSQYTCYCDGMPSVGVMVEDQCEFRIGSSTLPCKYPNLCNNNTDGWTPLPATCGQSHAAMGPDPQFLGNNSFSGWLTQVNHEIDIEIPANCAGHDAALVCDKPGSVEGSLTCIGKYNTANFNNYVYTDGSGTGPAYSNMCAAANKQDGTPMQFMADGQYHNYTIEWHTGVNASAGGWVDFYIDGVYMGTNNVFAPTRGSRFYVAHWADTSKNRLWNGHPDNWDGGVPGDGQTYNVTAYVSEVRITPFNEARDVMYPNIMDQPDGCVPPYFERYPACHPLWAPAKIPPPA